jgi:hypothetical protein
MLKEEGLRSFYKGYSAFTLAILIWMSAMPLATNFLMEKLPLYIDPSQMPKKQEQHIESDGGPIEYRFDEDDEDDYE